MDILAGFGLTPSALAVAPLATEAKKPMVVMNAATSVDHHQVALHRARRRSRCRRTRRRSRTWAAKNSIKKVYTLVADYGPGPRRRRAQFKKTFTAAGGEIVGEVRVPVKNPDFAPFLQKIKDAKPDAVFLFVPPGARDHRLHEGLHRARPGRRPASGSSPPAT